MSIQTPGTRRLLAPLFILALAVSTAAVFGQGGSTSPDTTSRPRSVSSGEKMKIRGTVVKRNNDSFVLRDMSGVDTTVMMTSSTSIRSKGHFLKGGSNYGQTQIQQGLSLEVEGRGDSSGQLIADRVRFGDEDLRVAQSINSRVNPVEDRVGSDEQKLSAVEANAQKLSGQLDELAAVSNAAKGGAKAAQETADSAVAGVNATNDRISALDDYTPQETVAVNFKVGSAVLLAPAKTQLDDLASKAVTAKGYVIEVSGYTDSTGGVELNRVLSQRRADAVIRYLVENHQIPLRRIITPYGYGKSNAIADNTTKDGRAQNRRVEVKMLVNKGLLQGAPTMSRPSSAGDSSSTNPQQ